MRTGSLCSGIGGLDLAVEDVWPDAEVAWFCESDRHAASVLERHWPGVPVLPDLKTQDWSAVEPVELVCAGYPCQPFSFAGKRGGEDDPRHLWPFVIDAVRHLGPRVVVLENVAGHLGLGFDAVLGDLAEAGFDAEWTTLRASDVGASHQRERLFVVATDAECQSVRVRPGGVPASSGGVEGAAQERERVRTDDGDGGGTAANPQNVGCEWGGATRGRRSRPADDGDAAADTHIKGLEGTQSAERRVLPAWGTYERAVRRWESVIGRSVPAPTDERGRLAVPFVEWMMGFDLGWVDGLTRTAGLRCLGNAVVPLQGAAALNILTGEVDK